jgi:hypothetical protein
MAAVTALDTATDRVRFALGDVGATSSLPGGVGLYASMLTLAGDDEAAVYVAAAGVLANYYAGQPSSVGSAGDSLSWADRVAQWRLVAAGRVPYPFATDGSSLSAQTFGAGVITLGFQETNEAAS